MERIGIREAARRLGVSDTAVHKALKAGRVLYAQPHDPKKPQVEWPAIEEQWKQNTDVNYRTHSGKRADAPSALPEPPAATQAPAPQPQEPARPPAPPAPGPSIGGPSFAQSRALREAYNARLAKLEFEERSGKLVDIDQLRIEAFKIHRRVRDSILNIPDRCAPQLATMSDVAEIHAFLLGEITQSLRMLSADIYAPQES